METHFMDDLIIPVCTAKYCSVRWFSASEVNGCEITQCPIQAQAVSNMYQEHVSVIFLLPLSDSIIPGSHKDFRETGTATARENDANKVHIKIEGIVSPQDMETIKQSVEFLNGVNHVEMDTNEALMIVSYDPDLTGPRSIILFIQDGNTDSNYQASLYIPEKQRDTDRNHEIKAYRNQFFWSCLFSIPVFVFSMVLPMTPPYGNWLSYKIHNMLTIGMVLRWILCTPVQFLIGRRFYVGSYHAIKRRSANMDVLVALGTNAAYFYSVYTLIKALLSDKFEGQDFFETSTMLVSFILLGKYLESKAKGKTSDALAKLIGLAPDTACLLTMNDEGNVLSETEISTQLIQRNDVLKIFPGSKFPVDGIVVDGQGYVNESMITGEATPVAKKSGDKVVVAAVVTFLGWFIPGVAGIYPKSWIPKTMDEFELALQFGISVLVVACPCAFWSSHSMQLWLPQ
ncbi:copper-transporting ATPase HMA4-like protein [Tanacetum coccineum]